MPASLIEYPTMVSGGDGVDDDDGGDDGDGLYAAGGGETAEHLR